VSGPLVLLILTAMARPLGKLVQMAHPSDDGWQLGMSAWSGGREATKLSPGRKGSAMPDTDYVALGRQFLAALGAQDWAALRALVTADVTWSFPGDARISGLAEGVDAVVAKGQVITSSGVHIELLNVLAGMNGVAVSLHNTASTEDGRSLDQYLVTVLSVREGKVYQIDSYLSDPAKIVRYFGRST
jgi:ketosteroid isomerase-like protein